MLAGAEVALLRIIQPYSVLYVTMSIVKYFIKISWSKVSHSLIMIVSSVAKKPLFYNLK